MYIYIYYIPLFFPKGHRCGRLWFLLFTPNLRAPATTHQTYWPRQNTSHQGLTYTSLEPDQTEDTAIKI